MIGKFEKGHVSFWELDFQRRSIEIWSWDDTLLIDFGNCKAEKTFSRYVEYGKSFQSIRAFRIAYETVMSRPSSSSVRDFDREISTSTPSATWRMVTMWRSTMLLGEELLDPANLKRILRCDAWGLAFRIL